MHSKFMTNGILKRESGFITFNGRWDAENGIITLAQDEESSLSPESALQEIKGGVSRLINLDPDRHSHGDMEMHLNSAILELSMCITQLSKAVLKANETEINTPDESISLGGNNLMLERFYTEIDHETEDEMAGSGLVLYPFLIYL